MSSQCQYRAWPRRLIDDTRWFRNPCGMFQTWTRSWPSWFNINGWFGRRRRRLSTSSHRCSMGDKSGETGGQGNVLVNILQSQEVGHYTCDVRASVVLLQHDGAALTLKERERMRSYDLIPVAYRSHISSHNHQLRPPVWCDGSPHHDAPTAKTCMLHNASISVAFVNTSVDSILTVTTVTTVQMKCGFVGV